MKIQTTFILLSLLLALAHGDTAIVNWAGNWDVKSTESETACYPDATILIEQSVGKVTASWVWGKTQPCTQAGIAGQKFTQTVQNPQGNSIDLKITVGKAVVDGTFTVSEDRAVFVSKNGASATYVRRQELVYWTGTWDIITQESAACNPDKSITLTEYSSTISASWTWANSQSCQQLGLAGQKFSKSIDTPSGNAVLLSFQAGTSVVAGMFAVIHDQAVFASVNGASATFVRRQELINWVGTWDLFVTESDSACYPDGYVTVLPSGSNLIASWIWAASKSCEEFGLSGKSFSQAVPVPKGSALSLNFIVGGAYISGILVIQGDKTVFLSNTGASAGFKRRPQMVNWAGAWDIVTQDKTACYPEGSITVAQTSTDITLSWTWANTSPCSALDLAGKKFSKTLNTPAGNSVTLDVSTNVSVLFTVFLDGAVFSTTGGASTCMRKEENVKFVGTWNIQNQEAGTACYPDTSIVITQDGTNVIAKWTWAKSAQCTAVGLAGKEFTQTEPTPRGRAIFLDFIVGTARVSGTFTVNGDQATFASNNGASTTFVRKPGSGFTTVIIIVLLILVVAVGGYFFVQRSKSKKLQGDLNSSLAGIYSRT